MGPVEESSALVAIKLLSPGIPPASLPSLSVPPCRAMYSGHLNYQTGHSHWAIQSREIESERERERNSPLLVFILHPPRSSGCSASSLLSHAHNFSSRQYANHHWRALQRRIFIRDPSLRERERDLDIKTSFFFQIHLSRYVMKIKKLDRLNSDFRVNEFRSQHESHSINKTFVSSE